MSPEITGFQRPGSVNQLGFIAPGLYYSWLARDPVYPWFPVIRAKSKVNPVRVCDRIGLGLDVSLYCYLGNRFKYMQIKILGWAGGIGASLRTTSFLIDEDLLVDAGTGLGDLPLNQMTGIQHIFLTHSHMDHIVGLPLLADTMFGVHDEPIVVYAQEKTIEALKAHVFNWVIWPDFSELPSREKPSIRFEIMNPGDKVTIRSREIEMIPVKPIEQSRGFLKGIDTSIEREIDRV